MALVLAGHDHHYERLEVQGLLHVVTGGGGAGLYRTRPPLPWSRALAVAHHALFLEVGREGLLGYALDPQGSSWTASSSPSAHDVHVDVEDLLPPFSPTFTWTR